MFVVSKMGFRDGMVGCSRLRELDLVLAFNISSLFWLVAGFCWQRGVNVYGVEGVRLWRLERQMRGFGMVAARFFVEKKEV